MTFLFGKSKLRSLFKDGADFFHFLFSEHLAFWFGFSWSTKDPVYLNLYTTMRIVFYLEK
jgi:hypothetical protein